MRINEIFYSLQGEGYWTGTPAIFIRFSGCNLACGFCDTDHRPAKEMTADDILAEVQQYEPCRHVVITGGEPALQLTPEFINQLLSAGYFVAVETNGTRPLPENVSWVTCSPKFEFCENAAIRLRHIDELKVVVCSDNPSLSAYEQIPADHYFLQPCDTGDPRRNKQILEATIRAVKSNPRWRLSLQTHKILNIP